ncbi:hypothetical protein C7T94_02275 [Pedobacter yulinensis]|uniref:Molybdopterin-synthase adenylyltransferase n=1 Tax=Pedobacter yulinensis TaxID=2126353 RepID=A0A2T3HRF2_9SPHI|nr:HesA/MoeB/ThiF family protein [Pedobacter yulinensis]PST84967.1 hypothetical protein C7T94_02275 [Pedobacter yulinensis]
MELSAEELQRYNRQIRMDGFGTAAQLKLKQGSVLVVGAGGLGCPALLYLAASGVGRLGIADNDRVSLSNLQRQVLFDTADIGHAKAEVAAGKLRKKNPGINIETIDARITADNVLHFVQQYDVIIDGTDNFESGYLLNDACIISGRPLIYGSLHQYEGQLSTFNHQGGPTLRCLFPEPPDDAANCSITGVLSVLPGLIGTWQAAEAIKVLTGIGKPLSGELLVFNGLDNRINRLRFAADPANKKITGLRPAQSGLNVDVARLPEQIAAGAVQVIDVREPWEFEEFNIGGINIPLSMLNMQPEGIDPVRDTVVVCQSGLRSARAVLMLQEYFPQMHVSSLQGGLQVYQER